MVARHERVELEFEKAKYLANVEVSKQQRLHKLGIAPSSEKAEP